MIVSRDISTKASMPSRSTTRPWRNSRRGVVTSGLFGIDYSWSDADVQRFQGSAPSLNPYTPVYGVTVPVPTTPIISYTERYSQTGIYAQDQIKFGDGFVATLGGRYDWLDLDTHNRLTGADTNVDVGSFSGRAGLSYVSSFGLAPYISYSSLSFRTAAWMRTEIPLIHPTAGNGKSA